MKKIIRASMFIFATVLILVFMSPCALADMKGDMDKNGQLSAADARFVLRASVGLEELTDELIQLADADNDGKISAADARLVLRASVGLESLGEVGHDHEYVSEIIQAPTCTKEGSKAVTCKICSYRVTETVKATGHTLGDWSVVLDSTVNEEGYERSYCDNCDYYKDRVIPVKTSVFFITVDYGAGNISKTGVASDGKYRLPTPRREGYIFKGYIDAEGKDFSATGVISGDVSVSAVWEIEPTDSYAELSKRANAGAREIVIAADITVTGPIYVPFETHIYSDGDFSIIRADSYDGDIFVVGSDKSGTKTVMLNKKAILTLGGGSGNLTVDGNRDNVTVPVNGSLVFVADSSEFNLYDGASLVNNNKTTNVRIYQYDYVYSETALSRMGGAAVMNLSSTVNMYGGVISNNAVVTEYTELPKEDGTIGNAENDGCGGAVYNRGDFSMYGGIISSNEALRGGAVYNDKSCYLVAGEVSDNISHSYGAAVASSSTSTSHMITGSENGTEKMVIKNNRSQKAGGALYAYTNSSIIINPNTEFINNHTESSGGAVYTAGALIVKGATFIGNSSESSAGAIYHHYASSENKRKQLQISDCIFEENVSGQGGAIVLSASGTAATEGKEGTYAEITDCTFNRNQSAETSKSARNGGAIYLTKNSDAIIKNCSFSENTSVKNAGAIGVYSSSTVRVTDCSFYKNTAVLGGAVYLSTDTVVNMTGVDFDENVALMTEEGAGGNGGAIYYSKAKLTLKNVNFRNNSAQFNAGAIYQHSATITLDDTCYFKGNTAGNHGGALYLTYQEFEDGTKNGSVLNANNVIFEENSALAGGAVSGRSASAITLGNVKFISNSTPDAKVNTTTGGGAIYSNNSEVRITDTVFDGNFSGYYGGAIRLDSCESVIGNTEIINSTGGTGGAVYAIGKSIRTENLTLKGNKSSLNGILYINCPEAEFDNLTATENTGVNGGVIFAARNSVVNINDSVLSFNSAKYGGALYIKEGGTVNADNCEFEENTASSYGGAVYVYGSVFNASGNSEFIRNTANGYGGAVSSLDIQDETTLEKTCSQVSITDCSFTENTGSSGGAVYLNDTDYVIENSSFTKNTALNESYGGGAVYNTGTTGTINNVTFTENNAVHGGAVSLYTNSKVEFSNITATGNTATKDGGVIYSAKCEVDLTNENIVLTDNKANNGGAVYALNPSVFDVSGVDLRNNEAENNGGALYVSGATVNIFGENTVIENNKAVNYGGAIYLSYITDSESEKIGGTLNITKIELKGNSALYGGAISGRTNSTINLNGVSLTENSTPEAELTNKAGGGAIYANNSQINMSACQVRGNSSGYYGGAVYTEKCNVSINDNTLFDSNNGGTGAALYLTTGSSLDAKNVTVTNNKSRKNGIIYLNGTEFTIEKMTASGNTASAAGGVIYTSGKGNLSITDSSFDNNMSPGGTGGVLYHVAGTVTIDNVSFTENSAKTGGVIYTAENGSISISNSSFDKNTATGSAGSVYQSEGSLTLSNTSFDENSSKNGGAIYLSNTDAQFSDVSFTNNTATLSGGAVDVVGARVSVTGTSVFTDNSAQNHGGAIYVSYIHASEDGQTPAIPGTLDVTGGTFTGNSATGGGAVSIRSDCEATFDGTVFTENTVSGYETKTDGSGEPDGNAEGGGAVYVGYGKLTFTNVTAENNEAFAIIEEGTGNIIKSFGGVVSAVSSEFTVTGGSFNGNKASIGGAFHAMTKTSLTISDSDISNNESSYEKLDYDNTIGGGAINIIGGSLDMDAVTLDGNKTGYYGGSVMASGTKVSILNGSVIKNSHGTTGAALHFKNKCDVTIKDSEIKDNISTNNGVVYANGSTLFCENIAATGNTAKYGGVFYISNKNTVVTVTGSTISSNTASASGGVAYSDASSITFTESNISLNTAKNGGVHYGDEGSSLIINNTVFTENSATSNGGAIYLTQAEASIDGSTFKSNASSGHGGAVYMAASTVSMTGENVFDENTAVSHGGAVYVVYKDVEQADTSKVRVPSVLNVTGGEFTKNTALGGGAVSIRSACEATFNTTVFTENTVSGFNDKAADGNGEGGGAVYVGYGVINLTDVTVTDNIAAATTTVVEGNEVINMGFGGAVAGMSAEINVSGGTFSDNKASVGGAIHLMTESELTVTGALFENNESDYNNKEHDNGVGGGAIKAKGSTLTLDSTVLSGNKTGYYGGALLASESTVVIKNSSTITLSEGSTGAALYFVANCDATITDSKVIDNTAKYNGVIYANSSTLTTDGLEAYGNKSNNGGVFYTSGAKTNVNINNSTIYNNRATSSGGVVYTERSTITFTGGTISDNAAKNGGIVYADSANISFTDTDANENSATENGGVVYSVAAQVTLSDGTLSGNSAKNGGVVYADSANISFTDTDANENSATENGGVVYSVATQVTLSGGAISENSAKNGGVIYGEESSMITTASTEFTGNNALSTAGVIYSLFSNVSVDGAVFTENTAKSFGGAIYLNRSEISLADTAFTSNSANYHGGGIYLAGSVMTATGDNVFTENTAKNHGGAVYVVYLDVTEEGSDTKTRIPSVLTMENGEFTGNTGIGGGAVSIRSACEASFTGTVFTENNVSGFSENADGDGESGGAIYVGYGALNLTNAVFNGNGANETVNTEDNSVNKNFGGAIESVASTVTITGGSFDGNKATSGGAINLISKSVLVADGVSFTANESLGNSTATTDSTVGGGAIRVKGSSATLTGVIFDGNKTNYYGAAVYAAGADVTINGDSQISNHSGVNGAALYFREACNIILKDIIVENNYASNNSVIYTIDGTFEAENISASGNEGKNGGVLYVNGSSLNATLKDSSFSNNTATSGGAIYVNSATLQIIDCEFNANTAQLGGGVYVVKGSVSIENVTFEENKAIKNSEAKNGNGGAVTVAGSSFVGTGDNKFLNNTAENHGGAVYVSYTTNTDNTRTPAVLTMTGGLFENNAAVIGGAVSVRTDCSATFNGSEFKSNSASSADSEGGGGAIYTNDSTVNLYYVSATDNSTGFYGGVLTGLNSFVTVENSSFSKNSAKTGPVFNLRGKSELTVNKVSMTDNTVSNGNGIIYATGTAIVDVTELTSTGNTNTNGGTFYVSGAVSLTIRDSYFKGNSVTGYAGVIDFRSSGTLSVSDSEFIGNTAKHGGAMNLAGKGAVEIKGCTFENNTATALGGALHITGSGKVDISEDTLFKGNTAPMAGAIYLDSGAKSEITSSAFEKNSATDGDGGAIMVTDTSEEGIAGTGITLKAVIFDSNTATGFGGALQVSGSCTADISQNTVFKKNSAVKAGAVYLDLGASAEITSSAFEENTATDGDGGAIMIADSSKEGTAATSLILNTVTFDGNKASSKGGAISTDTSSANIVITAANCVFNENKALGAGGGAIEIQNGNSTTAEGPTVNYLVFTNCKFTSNEAKTTGGAVEIRTNSCAKFDGVEATGNVAGSEKLNNGGVFYITSEHSRLYLTGTVTFSENSAKNGVFAYLYKTSTYKDPPGIYTTHSETADWVSGVAGNTSAITFNVISMP